MLNSSTAPVQGAELVDGKRRVELERQVRDGSAEVAIVVNDLVDRIAQGQKACPVCDCGASDFRQGEAVASRRARNPDA